MRGKHCYHTADNGNQRITPAGAGKTIYPFTTCINFRDHPRGCGENRQRKTFRSGPAGSPPRMRGKLQAGIDLLIALGITPADAGKTPESLFSMVRLQDHPRGCGENSAAKHLTSAGTGSPPRMRGKRCGLYKVLYRFRITPADAGKTDIQRAAGSIIRDHPRGCGENAYFRSDEDAERGSPPRMRGKLTIHVRYLQTVGITPADAGKTAKKRVRRRYTRDHPRGCGENCISRSIGTVQVGSPPRMRGKLLHRSQSPNVLRITPADAGKTEIVRP